MSAQLDVTFLGWTKPLRAREHPRNSTPTEPENSEKQARRIFFFQTFPFPTPRLSAAVDLLIYLELFRALMRGVTFSCFDAGGKM